MPETASDAPGLAWNVNRRLEVCYKCKHSLHTGVSVAFSRVCSLWDYAELKLFWLLNCSQLPLNFLFTAHTYTGKPGSILNWLRERIWRKKICVDDYWMSNHSWLLTLGWMETWGSTLHKGWWVTCRTPALAPEDKVTQVPLRGGEDPKGKQMGAQYCLVPSLLTRGPCSSHWTCLHVHNLGVLSLVPGTKCTINGATAQ